MHFFTRLACQVPISKAESIGSNVSLRRKFAIKCINPALDKVVPGSVELVSSMTKLREEYQLLDISITHSLHKTMKSAFASFSFILHL